MQNRPAVGSVFDINLSEQSAEYRQMGDTVMNARSLSYRTLNLGLWSQLIALLMGLALHGSAVLAGRALFFGSIFTPSLDLLLAPFIILGGGLGLAGQLGLRLQPAGLRWAGLAVSLYFIISIPFHAKTLLSWSTAHFTAFPASYSLFIIPLQLLFLFIVIRQRRALPPQPDPAEGGGQAADSR